MKFGIAVFPSKDVQDFANSYRKRYDPHYNLIPPHLTIREPAEGSVEDMQRALEHLDQLAARKKPFSVRFNRFSTFYPSSNVVYMALEDPQPFIRLYEEVCSGSLQQENPRHHYNPHLTVGQEMTSDELQDVYAGLRKVKVDLQTEIDRIHLLGQIEGRPWSIQRTFLFQGR